MSTKIFEIIRRRDNEKKFDHNDDNFEFEKDENERKNNDLNDEKLMHRYISLLFTTLS